jgi:serine/threonine protein kinase
MFGSWLTTVGNREAMPAVLTVQPWMILETKLGPARIRTPMVNSAPHRATSPFGDVTVTRPHSRCSRRSEHQTLRSERLATLDLAAPRSTLSADRFVAREVIAEGGMSLVVRAFDTGLQRDVAIKVPAAGSDSTEADATRLREEGLITAQLEHPGIVPVYELGMDARGTPFICMKLIEGQTLEEAIRGAGVPLLGAFVDICDVVAFAHRRGVLHCDLKPSNVMIDDAGRVFVIDWGLARRKERSSRAFGLAPAPASSADPSGFVAGTPRYMSPEQLRAEDAQIDERTDVYALGATLHHVLTGEPPPGPEPPSTEGLTANVPECLWRIVLKAMAHDPSDRYASVIELREDVSSRAGG